VLQNKGYIKFAGSSCVDVIALSDWEQALKEGHRTQTFKAPDEYGDMVEWLLLYPTLQPRDLETLYNSTTVSFNKTGIMPYTAIVDPHTEEEMIGIPRGQTSLQRLKDAVLTAKKKLNEQHGPSVSRKTVAAIRKQQDQIQDKLLDGNVSGAIAQFRKLQQSVEKQPQSVRELAAMTWTILVKTAENRLAEVERLLEQGKRNEAFRVLKPLARAFKGTELQERIEALVQKAQGG
jgi:hypothetical protein